MSVRDFLSNVTVILGVMALASVLEIVVPMLGDRTWTPGRRSVNLGLTATVFLLNWLLTSAVALSVAAFAAGPSGLMTRLALPQAAQIVLGPRHRFLDELSLPG